MGQLYKRPNQYMYNEMGQLYKRPNQYMYNAGAQTLARVRSPYTRARKQLRSR